MKVDEGRRRRLHLRAHPFRTERGAASEISVISGARFHNAELYDGVAGAVHDESRAAEAAAEAAHRPFRAARQPCAWEGSRPPAPPPPLSLSPSAPPIPRLSRQPRDESKSRVRGRESDCQRAEGCVSGGCSRRRRFAPRRQSRSLGVSSSAAPWIRVPKLRMQVPRCETMFQDLGSYRSTKYLRFLRLQGTSLTGRVSRPWAPNAPSRSFSARSALRPSRVCCHCACEVEERS
jgi:hypothetical protein